MNKFVTVLLAGSCLAFFSAPAAADDAPKWQGHIEAEGKWGTERSLGEIGLFAPIWQDKDTLLFADIRGRLDDQGSSEGNFGLGLRHQINSDWILGGYGFYDRRRTENDNLFHQATLGLEALHERYELRLNTYIPESEEKDAGPATSIGAISGGNFQIQNLAAPQERALPGADIEAGIKFDLPDSWELWAYGGAFHFDADGYDNVTGPRGRLELSYNNVPYLGEGSRFTVGLEAQTDDVRGGQTFGIARLRVPFSSFNAASAGEAPLNALDRRMTARITRDIDIVSAEQAAQVASTESATVTLNSGAQVSSFTTIDAGDNISADVTAAGANALIVLDGSAGIINTATRIINQAGQTILGGGSAVTITGTSSGNTATVALPGSPATVNATADTSVFIITGVDSVLQNLTISGSGVGVDMNGADNATLRDLIIQNTTNDSIQIKNVTNSTISGVTMINPAGGAQEGIQFGDALGDGSTGVSIANSTVQNANIGFLFVQESTYINVSFTNVSVDDVGSVLQTQAGANDATLNNPSGAITATNVGGVVCNNAGMITGSTLTINGVPCP